MGLESHHSLDCAAFVQRRHDLRDAEDQNIAVMHRRQAPITWPDLNKLLAALVAAAPHIRLGRDRENRVLHRRHIAFGSCIEDVAHEEVSLLHPVRKQGRAARGEILVHRTMKRVFTHSVNPIRVFTHRLCFRPPFVGSPTPNVFSHTARLKTCFYTPNNVFLHTTERVSTHRASQITHHNQCVTSHYPLRNTYI